MDPSPGSWAFHTHVYGLANVLLDRDGRVIFKTRAVPAPGIP
jgi:hypothetical protein